MNNLRLKRSLGRWFGSTTLQPRKVILLYHAVGEQSPAVTRASFCAQVQWLAANATVLPLPALLDAPARGLQVALSFDDGYASLHDEVAPLLREQGMSATVYVNTAHIGEQFRELSDPASGHYPAQEFLLWSEVRVLAAAGWEIGSHGVHHTDLVQAGPAKAELELRDSMLEIGQRLQQPCKHFAYTWGRFDQRLQQLVRAAGYSSAASTLHGPLLASSDRYALPRIDVRADYALPDFIAAVSGQWDWLRLKQGFQAVWR
jgi:peptidoglycan/xylan/chitin deacetylase (PgdA/CDA1 family)